MSTQQFPMPYPRVNIIRESRKNVISSCSRLSSPSHRLAHPSVQVSPYRLGHVQRREHQLERRVLEISAAQIRLVEIRARQIAALQFQKINFYARVHIIRYSFVNREYNALGASFDRI